MSGPAPRVVFDRSGTPAIVDRERSDPHWVSLLLASGSRLRLAADLIAPADGQTATADVDFADLDRDAPVRLTEVEERLHVDTETRETGRVRVHLRTETTEQAVEATGWREHVHVERVPVNRAVDRPHPPREVDGVLIVPVYAEELVVTRQLVLIDELHLTRQRESLPGTGPVSLRHQTVQIERVPANDPAPPSSPRRD